MFNVIEGDHNYPGKYIPVEWDDHGIGKENQRLGTTKLSSCVGVTLYDPVGKIGVMSHITGRIKSNEDYSSKRIVDTLLKHLSYRNSFDMMKLEAAICGDMQIRDPDPLIKSRTIEDRLKKLGIKLIGKDVGNFVYSRSMFLDCNNGNIEVYRPKHL